MISRSLRKFDFTGAFNAFRRQFERPCEEPSAIRNPITMINTIRRAPQFGISKNGKTCVAIWMSSQATTACAAATLCIPSLQFAEETTRVHVRLYSHTRCHCAETTLALASCSLINHSDNEMRGCLLFRGCCSKIKAQIAVESGLFTAGKWAFSTGIRAANSVGGEFGSYIEGGVGNGEFHINAGASYEESDGRIPRFRSLNFAR